MITLLLYVDSSARCRMNDWELKGAEFVKLVLCWLMADSFRKLVFVANSKCGWFVDDVVDVSRSVLRFVVRILRLVVVLSKYGVIIFKFLQSFFVGRGSGYQFFRLPATSYKLPVEKSQQYVSIPTTSKVATINDSPRPGPRWIRLFLP